MHEFEMKITHPRHVRQTWNIILYKQTSLRYLTSVVTNANTIPGRPHQYRCTLNVSNSEVPKNAQPLAKKLKAPRCITTVGPHVVVVGCSNCCSFHAPIATIRPSPCTVMLTCSKRSQSART